MGRRTVKIRYLDGKGLYAALEVRSYRSTEYTELILVSRLYTDNRVGSEHIRTDIQGCACSVRRYIGFICLYCLYNCVYKTILREYRHLQTLCRLNHTLCVQVRTEDNSLALLCGVCLHTLKYRLCVLQNACTLIQDYICVIGETALIPCAILKVGYVTLICLYVTKTDI